MYCAVMSRLQIKHILESEGNRRASRDACYNEELPEIKRNKLLGRSLDGSQGNYAD